MRRKNYFQHSEIVIFLKSMSLSTKQEVILFIPLVSLVY